VPVQIAGTAIDGDRLFHRDQLDIVFNAGETYRDLPDHAHR
jgi:hypothetical protein